MLRIRTLPDTTLGPALVLSAAAIAGTGAILAKVAYAQGFEPVPLLAVRYLMSTALLLPLTALLWPQQLRLPRRALVLLFGLAATNLTAGWFYFVALDLADASVVVPVYFTYPAIVLLLTRLAGEGPHLQDVSPLVVGWVGVWLISGGNLSTSLRVIAFSLASAAFFAVYLLLAQSALRSIGIQASLTLVFIFMAVGASGLWLFTGQHAGRTLDGWMAVAVMAVLSTVLARLAYYAGLKRIGSYHTALFGMAEPLAVLVAAAAVLSERLDALNLLGAALVLMSGVWSLRLLHRPVSREGELGPHG